MAKKKPLRVGDLMNPNVVCVRPEMTVRDAERLLGERRVTGAPVVDDAGPPMPPDAGTRPDPNDGGPPVTLADAGPGVLTAGCGCRAAGTSSSPLALVLAMIALAVAIRRRSVGWRSPSRVRPSSAAFLTTGRRSPVPGFP